MQFIPKQLELTASHCHWRPAFLNCVYNFVTLNLKVNNFKNSGLERKDKALKV